MPNLRPPITTTAATVAYRESIMKALQDNTDFKPLMTLYLTDKTTLHEIKLAREWSGVWCEVVTCWCYYKFSRWCYGSIWEMCSCAPRNG